MSLFRIYRITYSCDRSGPLWLMSLIARSNRHAGQLCRDRNPEFPDFRVHAVNRLRE